MDENRKFYDKRHLQKPVPYFNVKRNEDESTDENLPDFHIRQTRDIDQNGIFLNQRVFQPHNLNNNLYCTFNFDFGAEPDDKDQNRFVKPAWFTPKNYQFINDQFNNDDDEINDEVVGKFVGGKKTSNMHGLVGIKGFEKAQELDGEDMRDRSEADPRF